MGQWVAERVASEAPASVPGRLHAVNDGRWYPALVPGRDRVRGTVCRLRLRPGELALLDRYEGREYRRVALPARTDAGRTVAEAYLWQGPLPRGSVCIPGDFLVWLKQSGGRIFSGTCGGLAH